MLPLRWSSRQRTAFCTRSSTRTGSPGSGRAVRRERSGTTLFVGQSGGSNVAVSHTTTTVVRDVFRRLPRSSPCGFWRNAFLSRAVRAVFSNPLATNSTIVGATQAPPAIFPTPSNRASSPPKAAAPVRDAEALVPRPEARRPSRERSWCSYSMTSTRRAITLVKANLLGSSWW